MSTQTDILPPHEPGRCLLRCEGLVIGYDRPLLPPIHQCIHKGELVAVVGRNGAGKSTWFKTFLGLMRPLGGQVLHPSGPMRTVYLAQRMSFDDLYPVTAAEVVDMATWRGFRALLPRRTGSQQVMAALTEVGAAHLAQRTFRSLSEGQKQRVLLARLVAARADLALLDEPTAAMDIVAEREALSLMDRLRRAHGMAVVLVSHHLDLALEVADRVVFMDAEAGVVVDGTPSEVASHPAFVDRYGEVGHG